ncbi:MAG: IclR family transcriptional regulator [Firmicutes bacterium]|nr:IclR family transcriptional regulator [Bacillota bacterium]
MKMIDDNATNSAGLRTLERGLDILDIFSGGATKLTLTEIAAKINLSPSTASRLLNTLLNRGYLSRDAETKKYVIGSHALRLNASSFRTFDLRPLAEPIMRRLAERYNESITLYVALDGQRVCIDRVETTHALRHVVNVGDRLPLDRGAGGKVLLAWLSAEERKTLGSIVEKVSVAELAQIRKRGYAISMGERDQGVGAIAAPVFDAEGRIQCSLSLSAPVVRLDREGFERMVPDIVEAALQISTGLGYVK